MHIRKLGARRGIICPRSYNWYTEHVKPAYRLPGLWVSHCSPRNGSQECDYGWKEWFSFFANCSLIMSRACWLPSRKIRKEINQSQYSRQPTPTFFMYLNGMFVIVQTEHQEVRPNCSLYSCLPMGHFCTKMPFSIFLYAWQTSLRRSYQWVWRCLHHSFFPEIKIKDPNHYILACEYHTHLF